MNKKPLVTLIIFAYKAEKFIAETIDGALNQTYDNLEIIVSDDCSPDGTALVIHDKLKDYKGPHKIIVNINKENMGLLRHLNKLFSMAHGEIIATNPGDDVSLPNRIQETVDYFSQYPNVNVLSFAFTFIDGNSKPLENVGVAQDVFHRIDKQYLCGEDIMFRGIALAVRKKLFDVFGFFNDDCPTEDSTLRFRGLLLGDCLESSKIVFLYRKHGNNISMGSNLYTLKTDLFVKQFNTDIDIAMKKGFINSKTSKQLKIKVQYFRKLRNIDERLFKCNFGPFYRLIHIYRQYISYRLHNAF